MFLVPKSKCSQSISVHISAEHHTKYLGKSTLSNQGKLHSYHLQNQQCSICVGIRSFTKVTESRPQASRQHSYSRTEGHYFLGYPLHTAFAWSRQPTEKCAGSLMFLRTPENMHSYQWPHCFTQLHFLPGKLI